MLVGVDNFKELNEKYGAKTGDEVLNILTDAIQKIYRYISSEYSECQVMNVLYLCHIQSRMSIEQAKNSI